MAVEAEALLLRDSVKEVNKVEVSALRVAINRHEAQPVPQIEELAANALRLRKGMSKNSSRITGS